MVLARMAVWKFKRRGLDPDNVTVPISTSVSDVLGILGLLFARRLVGLI